jgi:tryptophan halogenase
MKKFIIVGSGTSGLIAASMIKKTWGDKCQVSVIYNAKKKNIGVGESTTPIIHYFVEKYLLGLNDLLKNTNTTIKTGINFKNWIPDTEYFHGFPELDWHEDDQYRCAIYSLTNGCYNGGILHNTPSTTVPTVYYQKLNALHIDTQELSNYIYDVIKNQVNFFDDIVEEVYSDGKNITGLKCKENGIIDADYYIDCSGFDAILLKELNPTWNDISNILPLNRAIPQQIPFDFSDGIPSYTLAEATKNGWIWRIPIGNRYGTGYVYSSKFTTDEEARKDFNNWLKENLNSELKTDKIIEYSPGYYSDYWIGNCLAVGLSSGFVEPLESTGIHIIIQQLKTFIEHNSSLKNLEYNKKQCNNLNKLLYEEIIEFITIHYYVDRKDSKFWDYMFNNRTDWIKTFSQKCKEEFLLGRNIEESKVFWEVDSYIQVANGLRMFDNHSIKEFLDWQPDKDELIERAKSYTQELENSKKIVTRIPHKEYLDNFR